MQRRTILRASAAGLSCWCLAQKPSFATLFGQSARAEEEVARAGVDCSSIFHSLDHWMTLEGQSVESGWQAKDGSIFLKRSIFKTGHIVTKKEFGDFELGFDWKIAKGGNSGIKYRVRKYGDRTLGCEYQIYDPNGKQVEGKNKTASLYDLYAPDDSVEALPPGQWNSAKIIVRENKIEHWLNGQRVVSAVVGDEQWERRIAESKFNDADRFSRNQCGRIMLTDHGSDVYYRNFQFVTFETKC